MNNQTHKFICNFETHKGTATLYVPMTLLNFTKGKHLGTTFPSSTQHMWHYNLSVSEGKSFSSKHRKVVSFHSDLYVNS